MFHCDWLHDVFSSFYPSSDNYCLHVISVRMNLASMQGKHTSITGIVREQGFMSLYDGLAAGVMRQVFYASSRLGLFDTCRDWLHEYRGKTDFAGR